MRPYLVDLNETVRRCGQDAKLYLMFSKLYGQMFHLSTKGMSTVYENLGITLYMGIVGKLKIYDNEIRLKALKKEDHFYLLGYLCKSFFVPDLL